MAAKKEFRCCWQKEESGQLKRVDQGFIPRKFKEPLLVGVEGLGCVTHPVFLREGRLLGDQIGLIEIEDPRCMIEVRDELGEKFASQVAFDCND